jgi:hypothetical protein
MEIFKPIPSAFDYSKITLANPQPLQGNSYFTKINYGENAIPLYIQFPKCLTKQAITATKRGKYCDLMYERGSVNDEFIEWIEQLESQCQDKIDEKKQLWFQNEFTRDDIETMMTPIARMYKSGKYVLIRAYINENKHTGKDKCIVYNENEVNVDLETINEETCIIPLLLIEGIKFTSRSFEIDIKIVQIMVLDKAVPEISTCLIKKNANQLPLIMPLKEEEVSVINASSITSSQNAALDLENTISVDKTTETSQNRIALVLSAPIPLEKPSIEEIEIVYANISDTMSLKKPNEVYYEQYRLAKQKALEMRENAIQAILEANSIKQKYNLEDDENDKLEENF